jgi:type II secretory pathway component PulJ
MRRDTGAFTLLEVLAVVLLTALVLGIALDFYVDLSRASNRAAEHTRDIRRATALLDRVARDFESAFLIQKPADVDPLSHPWLFLAESEYSDSGADQIKFVTRGHRPRRSEGHESDLSVVSYTVRRDESDTLDLLRWSSPRLPESLERSFPRIDETDSALLADGLLSFGVTFLDEAGEWSSSWDSTQLVESSELPVAVEIEVAMATGDPFDADDATRFRRRVLLPVRPLDLELLLNPEDAAGAGAAEEEEEEAEEPSGGQDEGSRRTASGVPTVQECVRAAVVGRGGGDINQWKPILNAHGNDPITDWATFILQNNLTGYIHSFCMEYL